MTEKPILFNHEMVKAILDERKTMTRRIVKDSMVQSIPWDEINSSMNTPPHMHDNGKFYIELQSAVDDTTHYEIKPPYQPGDILWVRETWTYHEGAVGGIIFKARCPKKLAATKRWKPSIHMPRKAARLFLKVKNVRVERLQDITEEDARNEGCIDYHDKIGDGKFDDVAEFDLTARDAFAELWNSTVKKQDTDKYGWEANPWVWVIEFERVEDCADD